MASEDKIFLDTDVVLDHLADRQPFAEYAHRLLALAETRSLTACVSALTFSNLYYILRKLKGHADTLTLLRQLKSLVQILPVTDTEITSALSSSFKDFEDAIQYFAAKADGHIISIVTRNRVVTFLSCRRMNFLPRVRPKARANRCVGVISLRDLEG